jgi:hypothetical protein
MMKCVGSESESIWMMKCVGSESESIWMMKCVGSESEPVVYLWLRSVDVVWCALGVRGEGACHVCVCVCVCVYKEMVPAMYVCVYI